MALKTIFLKTCLASMTAASSFALPALVAFAAPPLKAHPPITVSGGPGGFD